MQPMEKQKFSVQTTSQIVRKVWNFATGITGEMKSITTTLHEFYTDSTLQAHISTSTCLLHALESSKKSNPAEFYHLPFW
jgi:hypothetical protein